MASIKIERLREKIKADVAQILLREVKDPRRGFVTVVGCDLSRDLRHATIRVSVLGEREGEVRRVLRMLDDARGFIQGRVASRLRTRITPELRFVLDRSAERAVKISALLDDLKREREEREAAQGGVPGAPGTDPGSDPDTDTDSDTDTDTDSDPDDDDDDDDEA